MPGPDRLKPVASALSPPVEMVQNPAPGTEWDQLLPLPSLKIASNVGGERYETSCHQRRKNSQSPSSQVSLQSTPMLDTTAALSSQSQVRFCHKVKIMRCRQVQCLHPHQIFDDIDETRWQHGPARGRWRVWAGHHSACSHDYVYNPRLEVKESRVQDKVYSVKGHQ